MKPGNKTAHGGGALAHMIVVVYGFFCLPAALILFWRFFMQRQNQIQKY